jgi:hypothetical protein
MITLIRDTDKIKRSLFFFCHFTQPSSGEITGIARGLSESASGGRVSQRPVILSSAGDSAESGTSDRLPFLLVRFLWASKENEQ